MNKENIYQFRENSDHLISIYQFIFCSTLQMLIIYNLHIRKVPLGSYHLIGLKPRVLCKSQAHLTKPFFTWNYSLGSG